MAVTTSYSGSRRKNTRAAAFAAKQKRQKVIVGVGLVLLVLILAYEVPHTMKMIGGSSSSSTAATTTPATQTPATPAAPTHSATAWQTLGKLSAHDPFVGSIAGSKQGFSNVAVPPKLHDPFGGTASASTASSGTSSGPTMDASASSPTLPKTIVVGSPGAGRSAHTGWIVILASIPSGQGRTAANAFAKKAGGRGVGAVSILDSSKAKPLRSGYWVVYTGPFPTLAAVTKTASHVHAVGYGTAYVRQLVVYGKS